MFSAYNKGQILLISTIASFNKLKNPLIFAKIHTDLNKKNIGSARNLKSFTKFEGIELYNAFHVIAFIKNALMTNLFQN